MKRAERNEVMNFKEKYQAGEVEFEEIDDYVWEWSNREDDLTLARFLGLSEEEEAAWIDEGEEALRQLLDQKS